MNTIFHRLLILAAALTFLAPAVRSQQPQKSPRPPAQDDRLKKLEDRLDAAEKSASASAMERDYIQRTQKLYESYYQKTFNLQMWTLALVGFLLIVIFSFVVRFSVNLFEQRTKLATTDAIAQMRNEHTRTLAREVQKLWDSNAADNKKLRESLAAKQTLLEQNLRHTSEFGLLFVQGLAAGAENRLDDSLAAFRQALLAYKAGKPQNLLDTKMGAATLSQIFESLRKAHTETFPDKAREELAAPLYNGLEQELALSTLQNPWLTPLINERVPPVPPPPPAPEPAAKPTPVPPISRIAVAVAEPDPILDDESDSCRLITT